MKHGRREAARGVARREELEALLDPGDAVAGDGRGARSLGAWCSSGTEELRHREGSRRWIECAALGGWTGTARLDELGAREPLDADVTALGRWLAVCGLARVGS